MNRYQLFFSVFIVLFYISCIKSKDAITFNNGPYDAPIRPSYFPAAVYQYKNNPYSHKGFELGRKLFFDPVLSVNNTISCASCHKPEAAFADAGSALSEGIYGRIGRRHSPAIFNIAWNNSFMWDGGVNHIEVMPLAPLTNPLEMGEEIKTIVKKLNSNPEYVLKFKAVFNRDTIDDQQVFWSLAQYMTNIVSYQSKYDRYISGTDSFTANEYEGYTIYKCKCSKCHTEPLFTNYSFQNNGLDLVFKDSGRFRITLNPEDMGRFKVPSLRNIALTYPYMHDGRFATLDQVINHYSDSVNISVTLSPLLYQNGHAGFQLNEVQKTKLIAFLYTLTDSFLIRDPNLKEVH